MARLLLIRHAPTPETGRRLTGRNSGVSLDEAGAAQARRTATALASVPIRAVYASPIERTWETAQAVAEAHRLEPVAHEGLLEVDYGDWSGRTLASLAKLKAWRVVQFTPSRVTFPNGEALADAQRRGVRVCEELAARHRKATIALVTHADIIKSVVSHYLGQSLDHFQRVGVAPASVSVLDLPPGGPPMVVATNTNGDPTTWR